jgi:hypothetical protein
MSEWSKKSVVWLCNMSHSDRSVFRENSLKPWTCHSISPPYTGYSGRNGIRYAERWIWKQRKKKLYVHDIPWRELQVDVCFPFGRTRREVRDAIDDCSRFACSKVHTEHSVRSSMEFVDNVLKEVPFRVSRIRTGCGMEFWPWFTKFLERKGIEHIKNAPYTPRAQRKSGEIPEETPATYVRTPMNLFSRKRHLWIQIPTSIIHGLVQP